MNCFDANGRVEHETRNPGRYRGEVHVRRDGATGDTVAALAPDEVQPVVPGA